MFNFILGEKIKQTRRFNDKGEQIPVTEIKAGPCFVLQIKTLDKDKYSAVQLGFGMKKKLNKPQSGHLSKYFGTKNKKLENLIRTIKEVRLGSDSVLDETIKNGSQINVADVFTVGDKIKISGISKGKGFAGVVKRHHFHGGPKTHGQSDRHRAPGSIGQTTTPGRVYKGKRMAGHMGNARVTVKGLTVFDISGAENKLFVKGLVPGFKGGLLEIKSDK